nr:hypothetical protein [Tanacetum cinerariifolium]
MFCYDDAISQAQYISEIIGAFRGNYGAVRDYLLINGGMYQDLAKINGDAVKGCSHRRNGSGEGCDGGAMKEVAGVYKMLATMFDNSTF